ncbi:hypothetical protein [Solirhodobacter olei]|uniref:hypothetical protein n=1 Tax=Solirhodobacter olei TaxID=2493082 RepID=UPI000FD737D9|nr:hypothetical protein [Solirhodobacter olei]
MIEAMFLDTQTLAQLAEGPEEALTSALIGALGKEAYVMRKALISLLRAVSARNHGSKEILREELRKALQDRTQPRPVFDRGEHSDDVVDYLFKSLELHLSPNRV